MSLTFIKLFIALSILCEITFAQHPGELLSNTRYDYAFCQSSNHQIEMVDIDKDGLLDPVVIIETVDSLWHLAVYYKQNNIWSRIEPFQLSFPYYTSEIAIDYCSAGPLSGKYLAKNSNYLSIIDPNTWQYNTFQTNIADYVGSVVYLPDGTMFAITDSLNIHKSTDLGVTFNAYTSIGIADTTVNLTNTNHSSPRLKVSENGQYLSSIGFFGKGAINGIDDIVYLYYSTNAGLSWQGKIIGIDGVYGQVINRNYAPYFENLKQFSFEVDNSGVTHIALNGYGVGILPGASDTTDVFPALYWNSRDENWIAITDPNQETPTDVLGIPLQVISPGCSYGNAYPSISLQSGGEQIIVLWQSPELVGEFGSPYNIYRTLSSTPYVYSDLFINHSFDGGINWSFSSLQIPNYQNSYVEQFPIIAKNFLADEFSFKMHFIYQYDSIPGSFVLGQNARSVGGWYYDSFDFTFTDVEEINQEIHDFNLSQNYPNPFNPSTKISWQSPVSGWQTIKVYDVLGNEISTLINEERSAGKYEVEFDGSKLSSGVYFYQIKAGDFVDSKKMILMK
jgi:hypothetical protein